MSDEPSSDRSDSYDRIAEDLQQLRRSAGMVSYAEIVRRIARNRQLDGTPPDVSRPARTTVYEAFQFGRVRLNPVLIGEIAQALGESRSEAAHWIQRCHDVQQNSERRRPISNLDQPPIVEPESTDLSSTGPRRADRKVTAAVTLTCVALNYLGHAVVGWLHLSLYLDMIGTAIAAMVLGPWYGVGVGVSTNLIGTSIFGPTDLPFTLVNAAGAVAWGYGIRRLQIGSSIARFLALNFHVALVCSAVAVPILLMFFGGGTGHAAESVTRTLELDGSPTVIAVLQANLLTSIADKLLTGFIALAAMSVLSRSLTPRLCTDLPIKQLLNGR